MKWLPDREARTPGWGVVSIGTGVIVAGVVIVTLVADVPNGGNMTEGQFVCLCVLMWLFFVWATLRKTKAHKDADARRYAEAEERWQKHYAKFRAKQLKNQQGDGI